MTDTRITWDAKDPADVLDYRHVWSKWLRSGDTISESTFSLIAAHGLVIDSQSHDDTSSTVWLSGGTDGETAVLNLHVVTAGGREFDRSFALPICER